MGQRNPVIVLLAIRNLKKRSRRPNQSQRALPAKAKAGAK